MRKVLATAVVAGALVGGPFAGFAAAAPPVPTVPKNGCELAEAIGVVWVRECGEPDYESH